MKFVAYLKTHAQEREIKPGKVSLLGQLKYNKISPPTNQSFSCRRERSYNGHSTSEKWFTECRQKFVTLQNYSKALCIELREWCKER